MFAASQKPFVSSAHGQSASAREVPMPIQRAAVSTALFASALSLLSFSSRAHAVDDPGVKHVTQGNVDIAITRVPEKRLDFTVVVPASLDQVWQAMTTSDGLVTWLTPAAQVELKVGGLWQCDFPGGKIGGGSILSFMPKEMLAVAALAPEEFPTVRKERTQAIFFFDAVDATHTRVRLSQIGWKTGDEWDKAFAYLAGGNAQLLNALHHRFASGPIDWEALMGGHKH
jgi:uncharacterized protein YndB with AHSA1/START domain